MFDLASLFGGQNQTQEGNAQDPAAQASAATPTQSAVAPVSVQAAPRGGPGGDFQRSAYNNLPDIQMAQQGQAQDPQHSGLFGVHGTLRNVLGILGDAFLLKQGEQPLYAQRVQQERMSDAMTGFASDPMGAINRVAALPGGSQMADQMYNSYQQQKLREAQQESNNAYRQNQMDSRTDARDARLRQGIGGIMSAAAATGDPQQYAAARATALRMGGKVSDFDEDEIAPDIKSYNAGYGQTARQFNQSQQGEQRIPIAQQNADANTIRARNSGPGSRPPPNPTDASLAAPILKKIANAPPDHPYQPTPAEQDVLNRTNHSANRGQKTPALNIPGLTPKAAPTAGGGAAAPGQFREGVTYTDAHGNRATYRGGQWVPVH